MRLMNKITLQGSLLVAAIVVVSIFSCNKSDNSLATADKKVDKEKIAALLNKFYEVSDESGDEAVLKSYEDLSAEEFALFTELRNEREKQQTAFASKAEQPAIQQSLALAHAFRAELDKRSVEKYKVHTNKLTLEQLREIGNSINARELANSNPSAKDVSVMACPLFNYDAVAACETGNGGIGRYSWLNVINSAGEWPCDSEHRFDGWYNKIKGVDVASRQAIRYYGCLGRRLLSYSDGIDTAVILGYGGMIIWLGYSGYFNAQMRWE